MWGPGMKAATAALAATGALALGACGDDEDDGGGGTGGGAAATTQAPAEPASMSVSLAEQGKKAKFTAPTSLEAGLTELTFTNEGKDPHEAQLVRVDGDQTAEDVLAVIDSDDESGKIPAWLHGSGGTGTVAGGGSGKAVLVLEPGNYYLTDASDEKEAPPVKIKVTGEAGDAELPAADATITAKDFSFETSGLKAGANTIRFENTGKELHHALAFPIKGDADAAAITKFFQSEGESGGPPPVDFEKSVGTSVLDGGTAQNVTLDLQPGRYAMVCFLTNRAGGPPHVAMGMIKEVEVPS